MSEKQPTILVIDDETIIRESIKDYLEDRDFRVLTAEGGNIGLDTFTREKPDLVLTDLRMPGIDGLEVLRRASDISPETPLIVVSGTGQINDSIQALRLGAWDYILKPVEDMSIISHAIGQALEQVRLKRENRAYQEQLEMLVHERTEQLEQANIRLTNINARLQEVVSSTRNLAASANVAEFGSTLLKEFTKHLNATGGSLFLLEENGLRLAYTQETIHVPEFIPFPLPEKSIFEHVIKEEKPLLITDILQEKEILPSGWEGYLNSSVLAFPLPDENGDIVGILALHSKTPPPFTEQDKEIGAILASYSSETLRATRSMEALNLKTHQQEQLIETARHLTTTLDVEEVLTRIGKGAKELLQATGCTIYLLEPDNKTLRPVVSLDPPHDEAILSTLLKIETSFTGHAVKTKQGAIFNSVTAEHIGQHIPDTPKNEDESLIVVPFLADNQILGAMCLSRIQAVFSENDLALAEAFAVYASSGLKNAQAHSNLQCEVQERIRVEKSLRESETRYRRLFELLPYGAEVVDLKGIIIDCNPNTAQMLGYERNELIGKHITTVLTPNSIKTHHQKRLNIIEGNIEQSDIEMVHKDGSIINVLRLGRPLYNTEGKIDSFLAVNVDITERVNAEKALKASESKYRALFEGIGDAIFVHPLVENDFKNFIEVNEAACKRLGYTREELLALSPRAINPPDDALIWDNPKNREELIKKHWVVFKATHVTKTGEQIPVEISSKIFDFEGQPVIMSLARDITERVRMQQQLRQQEQLAAVGQLAAGIAHDFRNRLTSTILYTELTLNQATLDSKCAQYLGTVISESEKASELVQQILDFSSHSMLQVQTTDLLTLAQNVISVLQHTIPEHVRLSLSVGPSAPFTIEADTGRIEQVLINLATNARDAMPEGGELNFSLAHTILSPEETPPVADMKPVRWVCLSISDTGTGMSKDVQAQIFKPFFTTKDVGKGTGLGLAQVYGIVRQHNGYIDVESEVGKGTTFHVYLPSSRHEVQNELEDPSPASIPQGRGETILLVEDNKTLRESGQEILGTLGYKVLTAKDGFVALEVYKANPIDMLITDMIMPGMGGKELVQRLKQLNPSLKALSITGYAGEGITQEIHEAGFSEVLPKPFETITIAKVIRRILDS